MKVFKINKKEFIVATIYSIVLIAVVIMPIFVPKLVGNYLCGIGTGLTVPLLLGFTRMNHDKNPIEIIEIPEGKEN